jgi:PTS system nitrogen regulatory IIA component
MKLSDFLSPERVIANLTSTNKQDALREITSFLSNVETDSTLTPKHLFNAITDREELGSTGIGDGVAIPHAKIHGLKNLCACFARSTEGVNFKSIDQEPVLLIFMLLVPENSAGIHLKALARISRVLKEPDFREHLLQADNPQAIYEAFIQQDNQA